MKFLEMHELGRLSSLLTDCVLGDQVLNGRIEAYSCKKARDDKKLSKQLQQKFKRRKRSGTFTLLAGALPAGGTEEASGGGGGGSNVPSTSSFNNSTSGAAALASGRPAPPSTSLQEQQLVSTAKRIPSSGESQSKPHSGSPLDDAAPPAPPVSATPIGAPSVAAPASPSSSSSSSSTSSAPKLVSTSAPMLTTSSSSSVTIQIPKRGRTISNSGLQRQGSIHSFESEGLVADGIEAQASDLSVDVSNSAHLGEDISGNASLRKVVINLISTLNAMHEDFDFSDASADRFVKHSSYNAIIPAVNKNLAEVVEIRMEGFLNRLWSEVDKAINVRDCEVFSYLPTDGDPFVGRGVLWSFNYFFYNSAMNRVLCFMCTAESKWNQERSRTPGRLEHGGGRGNVFGRNDLSSPPVSPGGGRINAVEDEVDLAKRAERERLEMMGLTPSFQEFEDEDDEGGYDVADHSDRDDDEINGKTE
eukprot:g1374.t1